MSILKKGNCIVGRSPCFCNAYNNKNWETKQKSQKASFCFQKIYKNGSFQKNTKIQDLPMFASCWLQKMAKNIQKIQVVGALLSIYITFHDADVLLIMHNSKGPMWLGSAPNFFFRCGIRKLETLKLWNVCLWDGMFHFFPLTFTALDKKGET